MNKQQKEYLIDKLRRETYTKKDIFYKDKPVAPTKEEKIAKLKAAGFVPDYNGNYSTSALGYLNLPPSKIHEKNKKAIDDFNAKIETMYLEAVDQIELGDSKDALEFLKEFQSKLEKL